MHEGIELDPEMLVQVLQNRLAQAAIREAQMEAALQSVLAKQQELLLELEHYTAVQEEPS